MTQNEVINKLSMEMALELGDFDYFCSCRKYIQRALVIGTDHFAVDMEEVIQMDHIGQEIEIFKSVGEASQKTGIRQGDISAVLTGVQHSAGGFLFVKSKDKELIPGQKTA
jgi:hypothetical protein